MDIFFIKDLTIETTIGIYEWEQHIKQPIRLDIEISYDSRPAAKTDNIKDALDYDSLAQEIIEHVSMSKFHLIESLGNSIADLIMEKDVSELKLTLYKPRAVKSANSVGLIITRKQPALL